MAESFLGEIRVFPYNRIPKGWIPCNGQLLPINTNTALFSLLSTTYGGDGKTNFAVPNLQGRVPVHFNPLVSMFTLGTSEGEETHLLTSNEIPSHTHTVQGFSANASEGRPSNNIWGNMDNLYNTSGTIVKMSESSIGMSGKSQPHNNMQPYLALTFCISTIGYYPSHP